VRILPVTVAYDAKDGFRSRARIHVGQPIDPAHELACCTDDPVAAVRALTERIARRLRALAARDAAVARRRAPARHGAAPAAWLLPLAAAGVALNCVPYELTRRLARRATDRLEMRATYTVLIGFYLFPLLWVAQAAAVGWAAGPGAGLAVLLAAPASGRMAILVHDRNGWAAGRRGADPSVPVRAA
jgi:hypothetical protein